jgi:hypothetical protein
VGAEVNDPQAILFGIDGQSLFFDAPDVPSSVTSVDVFEDSQPDTDAAEAATSGAAEIDDTSLVFDAASGDGEADPTAMNLSDVTGLVVGRRYIAARASGEHEHVEIARIVDGTTTAHARHPLVHSYESGDTLKAHRMSIAVDAAWVSEAGNLSDPMCVSPRYRVRWQYRVAGEDHDRVGVSWFNLVRHGRMSTVTPADVEMRFPGWLARLPVDHRIGQGQRLIDQAEREVSFHLLEHGKDADAQRGSWLFCELVLYQARLLAHESSFDHGGENSEQLAAAKAAYERRFNVVREPVVNQQTTPGGSGGIPPGSRVWRR